ncbi:MAG: pilus assembly protein TadG-related protein [Candidatus Omnitrophota bacterium]
MLIYFHKNKCRYERGQLAPFFILVLVVLVIMAMVTINLSKVAFIKTDSSNAADAGALAGGSVMASVFNSVAQANSQLEASYWEFYYLISIEFALAISIALILNVNLLNSDVNASSAISQACTEPCSAIPTGTIASILEMTVQEIFTGIFIALVAGIEVSIISFSIAQYYYYKSIRDSAKDGREQAILTAHRLALINSGIGSKLKDGSPPEDKELNQLIEDMRKDPEIQKRIDDYGWEALKRQIKNNYRKEFSKFIENLGSGKTYTYDWFDGQSRYHNVEVTVDTQEVNKFRTKITFMPWPVAAAALEVVSQAILRFAYAIGVGLLIPACICSLCEKMPLIGAACAACKYALCAVATALLAAGLVVNILEHTIMVGVKLVLLATVWAGMLPAFSVENDSPDLHVTLCWLDDIVHNRKFRVDTWQDHGEGNLGLWTPTYPQAHSYSVVDFRGMGSIYPPVFRHDASIIDVDSLAASTTPASTDPCAAKLAYVKDLEAQRDDLQGKADYLSGEADRLTQQARQLRSMNAIAAADKIDATVQSSYTGPATEAAKQAGTLTSNILKYKADNAECSY